MFSFWDSFRDEMLATGLVLILTAAGSFFLVDFLTSDRTNPPDNATPQTLGANDTSKDPLDSDKTVTLPSVTPLPTQLPTPTPTPVPTPNPYLTEVPYGFEGSYGYDEYHLKIQNPRIEFNSQTNSGRKFKVDLILRNVNVGEGMVNRITATVIKDGKVIVNEASLSNSETKTVMPGEQLTFTASLALIEGTDVGSVSFKPGGKLKDVNHSMK